MLGGLEEQLQQYSSEDDIDVEPNEFSREEYNNLIETVKRVQKDIAEITSAVYDQAEECATAKPPPKSKKSKPPAKPKPPPKPKPPSKLDVRWNETFTKLEAYKEEHGHCNVPYNDPSLGYWVGTQRKNFFGRGTPMTEDRIQRLEKIGFEWDPKGTNWNESFTKLEAYKKDHGHCNVPQRDGPLGGWVTDQSRNYRKKSKCMTADRIDKLEKIGFVWDQKETQWNESFAKLKAYKEKHGHCNVPGGYPDDPSLGIWVQNQRSSYFDNRSGMTADRIQQLEARIQQLEAIGVEWDINKAKWNESFTKLMAYKEEHGHCNVPTEYHADPSLGIWVKNQRESHNHPSERGGMTEDRIQQLEKIGFEWEWRPPSTKWVVKVCKEFHQKHRHCHLPYPTTTKSKTLKDVWPFVTRLRKRVRTGKKVPKWVVNELEPLGFEFEPPSRRARRNRFETKSFADLRENGNILLNTWDESIEDSDYRPDALIIFEHHSQLYIIFKEIDEHRHDDRSITYEQIRMTLLTALAKRLGFKGIYFVRTNV